MADRGWALDDRPTGLFERPRIPDATAALYGMPAPSRTGLFENVGGDVGWYGQLKWDMPEIGQIAVLRYDNEADPNAATSRDSAWLTRFWNISLKTRLGGVALLAQAFTGDTAIGGGSLSTTYFDSAFLLASYDIGDWRLSARAEAFDSRTAHFTLMDEDGHALTAAAIWNARDWLRLTAEALMIDSRRTERALEGIAARSIDTQVQLSARVFL
ncbi:MAG TPA: hypothetical protein VHZ78_11840 [Rhizomicrobium sp.]|jgi:hypothetical protein|nr:hypothetical protein [Rhizomicrobium sp.]